MGSGYSTDDKTIDMTHKAALRSDGPTLEEYLAAGYLAADYPPFGYAEKPSEGLTLYRTTGQVPGKPAVEPVADLPPAAADVPAGDVAVASDAPAAEVAEEPPTGRKRK